jgi:DNA-binding transcriptional ArsR family regulator
MTEAAVDLVQDPARARSLLRPLRRSMLQHLAQPASAAELSRQLGIPRQRLSYHLRELEKQGFVELVEERRKGNCVERLVRATARTYVVDPALLGSLGADPERIQDRMSVSYLVAVAARAIRDLARLRTRAGEGKRIATLTLQADVRFASAADRHAFAQGLSTELARLVAKYHDERAPGGRRFRFFVGGYPQPGMEGERVSGGQGPEGTSEPDETGPLASRASA